MGLTHRIDVHTCTLNGFFPLNEVVGYSFHNYIKNVQFFRLDTYNILTENNIASDLWQVILVQNRTCSTQKGVANNTTMTERQRGRCGK